jgi:mevalonate kinase
MMHREAIGKIILSGEHAVVYGTPAIALPVLDCKARTILTPEEEISGVLIKAGQLNKSFFINPFEPKNNYDPLELTVINFLQYAGLKSGGGISLEIISDIPIASGMGSGAAIAVSMIKVLAAFYNTSLTNAEIYKQVFEIEKIYHGNPSGVDPSVIVYEKPVFFIRGEELEKLDIFPGFSIAIIDSEIRCSTKKVVDWVAWQKNNNPEKYQRIFDNIAVISNKMKTALETGKINEMGLLMSQNHILLKEMGVSNGGLDELVDLSLKAGAMGAKLSGAGWGGIAIALLEPGQENNFKKAMEVSGVTNIRITSFNR